MPINARYKYALFRRLLQRPPIPMSYALVRTLAPALVHCDPEVDRLVRTTLGTDWQHINVRSQMQQIEAQDILDTYMIANRTNQVSVEFDGFESIEKLRRDKHKMLLTTGHFGRYWPIGLGLSRAGLPTQAVIRDRLDTNVHGLPQAEFEFRRWKLSVMQHVWGCPFHNAGDNPKALLASSDHNPVVSLFDVPVDGRTSKATTHSFLNHTIRVNPNPARLAQLRDAYLVPFINTDANQCQFRYKIFEPLRARGFELEELNEMLVRMLETQIKNKPAAWWLWPALPHFLTETDESTQRNPSPH